MGQTENVEKAPKTSWFDGVKAEFKKIIWPEQKSVVRQTIAVIVTSVVVGLIIAHLYPNQQRRIADLLDNEQEKSPNSGNCQD